MREQAVGPGLVVPAMFQLQKTGLGRDQGAPRWAARGPLAAAGCRAAAAAAEAAMRAGSGRATAVDGCVCTRLPFAFHLLAGIPSTVVIAASFDDIVAITGGRLHPQFCVQR